MINNSYNDNLSSTQQSSPFSKIGGDEAINEDLVSDYKPISDLLYDWVTVLKSKSKGVEMYSQFIQDALERKADACVNLFRKLQQQDSEQIEEIKRHLAFMLNKEVPESESSTSVH